MGLSRRPSDYGGKAAGTTSVSAGSEQMASTERKPALGVAQGRLELQGGAAELTIRSDSALTDLYRIHADGPQPQVTESEGRVRVQVYRGFLAFDWRRRSVEIVLNPAVPWTIDIAGGAWKLRADLQNLDLRELAVSGGASDLQLSLPAPRGLVPVRFTGGASKVTLMRPPKVPAQVRITGGASKLTLDRIYDGKAWGELRFQTPDFGGTADAYDVSVSGGASKISIGTP